MSSSIRIAVVFLLLNSMLGSVWATEGVHLFILSGQSNMAGHRPDEAFTPAVESAFGEEHVVVVQDAVGGQPIQRWYKNWKSPSGERPKTTGDLYVRLMEKVSQAIKGKTLASVTLIWMQGERDAKMGWGSVYKESLLGLYQQVSDDLNRKDISFIIGRLSDYDLANKGYQEWTKLREIQVEVADSSERFRWVNTDDLNDGLNRKGRKISNDLHYSAEGYKILGTRFAESAIELVKANVEP